MTWLVLAHIRSLSFPSLVFLTYYCLKTLLFLPTSSIFKTYKATLKTHSKSTDKFFCMYRLTLSVDTWATKQGFFCWSVNLWILKNYFEFRLWILFKSCRNSYVVFLMIKIENCTTTDPPQIHPNVITSVFTIVTLCFIYNTIHSTCWILIMIYSRDHCMFMILLVVKAQSV